MLGNLDLDQLDNVMNLADNMAVKLAIKTSKKLKNLSGEVKNQFKSEKEKLRVKFLKRKAIIDKYMNRAPFVRMLDKILFVIGVLLLIMTTYMVGRYPNDNYYTFHCVAVISLVIFRFYNYKSKGWHYYLFDFCYFANTLMLIFLLGLPKNDILFKVFFIYANGPFGLAIPAFKNSMIFHKIDNLISCAIHLIP